MRIITDFDPRFIRTPPAKLDTDEDVTDGGYSVRVRVLGPRVECEAYEAPELVKELRRVADEVEAELAGSLAWARKGSA